MPSEQQPQQAGPSSPKDMLGPLHLICTAHFTTMAVFLHYGFGSEALGFPGLLALGLLLLSMGAEPLMVYWLIGFLVAVVIQRIITLRLTRQGHIIHSRYAGCPLLMRLPFLKKESDAMAFEALVCLILGAFMLAISQFLGLFVMAGFLSLTIRYGMEETISKRRLQQMQDAELEQRWLVDRFRRRGDDF